MASWRSPPIYVPSIDGPAAPRGATQGCRALATVAKRGVPQFYGAESILQYLCGPTSTPNFSPKGPFFSFYCLRQWLPGRGTGLRDVVQD